MNLFFQSSRRDIEQAWRETGAAPKYVFALAFIFLRSISRGDHACLRRLADFFGRGARGSERYYLGTSEYLLGNHQACLDLLQDTSSIAVDPADIAILKSRALVNLGRDESARREIELAMETSRRLKLCSVLADLVTTPDEFYQFEVIVERTISDRFRPANARSLIIYRIKAALRAGEYATALRLAANDLQTASAHAKNTGAPDPLSPRMGERALSDLRQILSSVNVPFFLISGTLLGAVREGRLLSHDNDLDVGVWAEESISAIRDAIGTSGLFFILAERTPWTLRIRHVNGANIDVFRHFRERETYWHGGVKAKWHNSPFILKSLHVLGNTYLVPQDAELYLRENYGDWKVSKKDFDSVFDTPNAEIYNKYECAVHCYIQMSSARMVGNNQALHRYKEKAEAMVILPPIIGLQK